MRKRIITGRAVLNRFQNAVVVYQRRSGHDVSAAQVSMRLQNGLKRAQRNKLGHGAGILVHWRIHHQADPQRLRKKRVGRDSLVSEWVFSDVIVDHRCALNRTPVTEIFIQIGKVNCPADQPSHKAGALG
ncbi:hypothetical protein SDC9_203899 [bioreactor metagenome]|uniref:Uncharacterized protein n=1 Tax=bioreactor metagenome TaxID=1076179 RepID=A0A645J9M8_9ZZZZ